jgi:hypothetical protein
MLTILEDKGVEMKAKVTSNILPEITNFYHLCKELFLDFLFS